MNCNYVAHTIIIH